MSIPFYVNPETVVREKAEFARRNVARGRPIVALEIAEGVLLVTENPSTHLRKTAELYDRVAFAGVGKLNEFDQLRIAGVRLADMKGFSYDREDVTAKYLANAYAQTLGGVFTNELKPFEVEILVAQVGETAEEHNEMYHVRFDGVITDEHGFMVMGGNADDIREKVASAYETGVSLDGGLELAVDVLSSEERRLGSEDLEVALLANTGSRRRFRRLSRERLAELVGSGETRTPEEDAEPA
jgi:proteasome alpha subunit